MFDIYLAALIIVFIACRNILNDYRLSELLLLYN